VTWLISIIGGEKKEAYSRIDWDHRKEEGGGGKGGTKAFLFSPFRKKKKKKGRGESTTR